MANAGDPQPLVLAVAQGTCDGALMYKESWTTMQSVSTANPFCNIVQVVRYLSLFLRSSASPVYGFVCLF